MTRWSWLEFLRLISAAVLIGGRCHVVSSWTPGVGVRVSGRLYRTGRGRDTFINNHNFSFTDIIWTAELHCIRERQTLVSGLLCVSSQSVIQFWCWFNETPSFTDRVSTVTHAVQSGDTAPLKRTSASVSLGPAVTDVGGQVSFLKGGSITEEYGLFRKKAVLVPHGGSCWNNLGDLHWKKHGICPQNTFVNKVKEVS